jgi:hypothetical protein
LALENDFSVPIEAQPFQILHSRLGEFGFATLGVEILDPQKNFPSNLAGASMGCGKCRGMADVKQTCGGRGDTTLVASTFCLSGSSRFTY